MQEKELNYRSAGGFAQGAVINARMRTLAMWSHYDYQEKVRAERMAMGLEFVYSADKIYINPRKNFIAIKLDNARVKDRRELAILEQQYERDGITKIVTDQSIIYRIMKQQ
jgi:hypothetical protein